MNNFFFFGFCDFFFLFQYQLLNLCDLQPFLIFLNLFQNYLQVIHFNVLINNTVYFNNNKNVFLKQNYLPYFPRTKDTL